jgi:hypothetical protein
MVQIDVH